jgi:glycosyltransferase involved in cell wall biosynthesis
MRILHVIPAFYPAISWGGPISSMYGLCNALSALPDVKLQVLATDSAAPQRAQGIAVAAFPMRYPPGYDVYLCRRILGTDMSAELLRCLWSMVKTADIVHLSAVYSAPTIPTLLACRLFRKPLVWSPHGALQRWEQSTRSSVKAFWERICWVVVPPRLVLHATSEAEAQGSRLRFPRIDIRVIPHGVEIPKQVARVNGSGAIRLLYLGRLHPIKGIENLLNACTLLDDHAVDWSLTIAGSGNGVYIQTLLARINELGLRVSEKPSPRHVAMLGEVSPSAKKALFESTDIIVVPSHTENFGMVVAEALAHGVPVIASTGTPWRSLDEQGCGLCVSNDAETLAKAIEEMSRMPLSVMGLKGRDWMQRECSWSDRARDMMALYGSLVTS